MPPLLELQKALRRSVVDRAPAAAAAMLAAQVAPERLDIYRNTYLGTLTKALRLTYPAVHRLVGEDFFDTAAGIFIADHPPACAYLDQYGAQFADFLRDCPNAAGLPYLPAVARLEWAVSRALHASDAEPIVPSDLAAVAPADHGRIRFVPHPSLGFVRADTPADTIWRAVLSRDDAALAALDLGAGPVHLLVERTPGGVEVVRLSDGAWQFLSDLCAGQPLQAALDGTRHDLDAPLLLAESLAAGRFVGFELAEGTELSPNHRTPS